MKKILFTLMGIFAFCLVQAQPDSWQVNSSQFEYSMTLSAVVQYEGTMYGSENDYLAAFVNDTCRGIARASYVEAYDQYMFFLTVFSNVYEGEEVIFKYYNTTEQDSLTGFLPITFQHGANLGGASDPFWVSDEEKVETYEISFTVDDGNTYLEGAAIYIKQDTLYTSSEGTASMQLPNGEYSYEVNATGYETYNDVLIVSDTGVNETVSLSLTTGIFDEKHAVVKVYPNPADDFVVVEGKQMVALDIIDMQGKIVEKLPKTTEKHKISVSDMAPGMYILRVQVAGGRYFESELIVF